MNFNHPVKELIWTDHNSAYSASIDDGSVAYNKAKLVLNGHDRFAYQPAEYFRLRQPYDRHTAIPNQNLPFAGKYTISTNSPNADRSIFGLGFSEITSLGGLGVNLFVKLVGSSTGGGASGTENVDGADVGTSGEFSITACNDAVEEDGVFDQTVTALTDNLVTTQNSIVFSFHKDDIDSDIIDPAVSQVDGFDVTLFLNRMTTDTENDMAGSDAPAYRKTCLRNHM